MLHNTSLCAGENPYRSGVPTEQLIGYDEGGSVCCAQIRLGLKYNVKEKRFAFFIMQLTNCCSLSLTATQNMYVPFPPSKVCFLFYKL